MILTRARITLHGDARRGMPSDDPLLLYYWWHDAAPRPLRDVRSLHVRCVVWIGMHLRDRP